MSDLGSPFIWKFSFLNRSFRMGLLLGVVFIFSFLGRTMQQLMLPEQLNIAPKISLQESKKMAPSSVGDLKSSFPANISKNDEKEHSSFSPSQLSLKSDPDIASSSQYKEKTLLLDSASSSQPKKLLPADNAKSTQHGEEILHAESAPPAQEEADTLSGEFLASIPTNLFETRVFTPTHDPFAFPTIHEKFTCP